MYFQKIFHDGKIKIHFKKHFNRKHSINRRYFVIDRQGEGKRVNILTINLIKNTSGKTFGKFNINK